MYIRCRNCSWEQDDYWDKSYNPLRSLLDWEEALLTKDLDTKFHSETGDRTFRNVIVDALHTAIIKVNTMQYKTPDETRGKNPVGECPICHEKALTQD